MPTRQHPVDEATRRARAQVHSVIRDARSRRIGFGLSQQRVAKALGCSRQLIGAIETDQLEDVGTLQLVRYCAALGLDLPIRAFPGGAPLRDIGQVRLIGRFKAAIASQWRVNVEVPVTADPRDGRAIDIVLVRARDRIGVEAITRFADSQRQTREALLKQAAAQLDVMVLVLSDTRHNRVALGAARDVLAGSFPISSRATMAALRVGRMPSGNGIVLL